MNARWDEWNDLDEASYQKEKQRLCDECVASLEAFIPGVRDKIDHIEAATPRTVNRYTRSMQGTSFGTKFEGLKISMGSAGANWGSVSCGLCWHYHVGLAGDDELRSDCCQQTGQVALRAKSPDRSGYELGSFCTCDMSE